MVRNKVEVINREISWLSFNHRVLQEAMDENVPLIERIRFLGIFSNNLDEFFRVRVATVKRIEALGKKAESYIGMSPAELLEKIQKIVIEQQLLFEQTYARLFNELKKHEIFIVNEKGLTKEQLRFVQNYFEDKVRPLLVPIMVEKKGKFPFLEDKSIYLAIKLFDKHEEDEKGDEYALVKVPSKNINRFLVLPSNGVEKHLILLEDIVRANLHDIFALFNHDYIEAFTIKLTRDAELDIDDDLSKSMIDKMSKSLKGRKIGQPVRLVYDNSIPEDLYQFLVKKMKLKQSDNLIAGGRYHNFKDFINFPGVGRNNLRYASLKPLQHPSFSKKTSLIDQIAKKDILLYYPYHSFGHIVDILREAAIDPRVKKIQITLYRVAENSRIINALTSAVKNGKEVNVLVELQARFDEEANIYWSNKLQEEGVKVIFGVEGLKVHSKLFLITRKEEKRLVNYAHIGTGNFHEGTAKIYTDHSLLTANSKITSEVAKVFEFFVNNYKMATYRHLMLSPYHTRNRFIRMINTEIRNAKAGKEAFILLKLNNLVDTTLVNKLYLASKAGVKIRLMIRGICAVIPGVKGMSENIEARSIVDRFLEHSRFMIFCNNGEERYFISSADWMTRNLDKRIEVTTPIYDSDLQQEFKDVFEMQWKDNVKARIIDGKGLNRYHVGSNGVKHRSQYEIYDYYLHKSKTSDKMLDLKSSV